MKTSYLCLLALGMLFFLSACASEATSAPPLTRPTRTPAPQEAEPSPTEAALDTPAPTKGPPPTKPPYTPDPSATASPVVSPTAFPTSTLPSGEGVLTSLAGTWRGSVAGQSEGPQVFTEQKTFEIRLDCAGFPLCLDVLQSTYFRFVSLPPDPGRLPGATCFSLYALEAGTPAAWPFYTACFTAQADGTLAYNGSGPLWGESGTLTRMDAQVAADYRTALNASCRGTLPPRLIPGSTARVTYTDGRPLNTRENIGLESERVGSLPEGARFFVLNGPVCQDGFWWWFIDVNGSMVWVAEGDDHMYFAEPYPVDGILPGEIDPK